MNKQDIYNQARDHLLKQNVKAVTGHGGCGYLVDDGKRCGIGGLMNDIEIAEHGMSGKVVAALYHDKHAEKFFDRIECESVEDVDFLSEIQNLHDAFPTDQWPAQLEQLAIDHDLLA